MSTFAPVSSTTSTLPWIEKYRPSSLATLLSHSDMLPIFENFIALQRLPHLLLYGPPGVGKTSTALAIAKTLNGDHYQQFTLELNASDERGIDVVRNQIKEFASSQKLFGVKGNLGLKLIILDECDAMTKTAQFALRRIIEKYTKSTRFLLCCNSIQKIIPALQSRCMKFRFPPLPKEKMRQSLEEICEIEKVNIEKNALQAIITMSQGDMRRSINMLQSTNFALLHRSTGMLDLATPSADQSSSDSSLITEADVYNVNGQILPNEIQQCFEFCMNETIEQAILKVNEVQLLKGISLQDLLFHLHAFILRLEIPPNILRDLCDRLADIEYRLASGTSEYVQLGSMIGAFSRAKHEIIQYDKQEEMVTQ